MKRQTEPGELLTALDARVLSDLERCRIAWEQADDPAAIAVAVTQVEMPDWLADALLLVLTDEATKPEKRPLLRRLWREREQDMLRRHRATAAASARALGIGVTWSDAFEMGKRLVAQRFDEIGPVTSYAIKKSLQETQAGIVNGGRFHLMPPSFRPRLIEALTRHEARVQDRLNATKKRGKKAAK